MKRTTMALLFCVAMVAEGHAQTLPKVFSACYTQNTGTTYRIKEPGLATQCSNAKHTEFSWIDGVPGYDHGALNGLADDDHPQYLLATGTRALAGNLGAGGFKITGLGAGTVAGDAVRFEQALKAGEAAGGDLSGTYPNPSVARLVGRTVATTAPSNGQVLTWNGSVWEPGTLAAPASGIADNVPNTLVQRDATGGFAAQAVQLGQLRLIGGGGLLASGGFGTLVVPATGGGDRFMWYPGKSALRAGGVAGTEWDDQNIGVRSVAIGFRTTASGANSIALGALTTASNEEAVALGVQTTASGISATALGSLTTASGNDATAMGAHTTASGIAASLEVPATRTEIHRACPSGRVMRDSIKPVSGMALRCASVNASFSRAFKFPDGTVQTSANAGGVTDHGMLTGLTDDDHLQYLLVDGVRASTDGFAVTGTIGAGRIPVSGSGTRLMWYPGKAAFRAGSTSNIVWDDFSIGSYSAALGLDTRANGEAATALGRGSQANGANSLAAGEFPQASGEAAVAMGRFAIASGVLGQWRRLTVRSGASCLETQQCHPSQKP